MNLVFLTPGTGSYYCGVCMRDNALAKELIRLGHDATMVPMYLPLTLDETAAHESGRIFYGGINVYLQQKFSFFRHTPAWVDRLFDAGGLLRAVGRFSGMTGGAEIGELTHSMLLGEDGNQAKELAKLIDWLQADAKPHAVLLSTALLAGLARGLKKALDVPVLCSLQGEDSFLDTLAAPWKERCWGALADRARDVDRFVSASRYFGDLMTRRMKLQPEQVAIVPNGIEFTDFQVAVEPPSVPTIGYLARLIPLKGLGVVLEAFRLLKKRGRFANARLRCAGAMTAQDGAYVEEQRRQLEAEGLAGDVEFLPNVSREEKSEFLRSLTLFSAPAQYGEAFGLYLLEAFAAGVPVVQPRTGAYPEILEESGAGHLYERDTPEALADAWETLLADPARARALGAAGRRAVETEYSLGRMAERFLELTRAAAARREAFSSSLTS